MKKLRTYNKDKICVESHIYEGTKLVLHLVYYFGFGYGYPSYHFENFGLYLPDLNYEITRFIKFVSKVISNPLSDVDNLALTFDDDLTIF